MEKLIIWKFEKHKDCGFIIIKNKNPNEKDYFVKRNNFWKAVDWDQVEARVIKTLPWVNPEAKITRVIKKDKGIQIIFGPEADVLKSKINLIREGM